MIILAVISCVLSLYFGSLNGSIPAYTMDALLSASVGLFSFHAYKTLPIYKTKTRLLCLFLITVLVVYMINLHLLLFTGYYNTEIAYTCGGVFLLTMLIRLLKESYNSDKYLESGTYILYKRPRTTVQFFITLILKHHGVSIVIDGTEFKFKNGEFVERQHISDSRVIYKRIASVPIYRARLIVGTKWKWFKNCFSIIKEVSRERKYRNSEIC